MTPTGKDGDVIDWLMAGDPAIRWQVMRDLLDEPAAAYEAERHKTVSEGWGAGFLAELREDGTWPVARWTDTVWTLPLIMDCGLPPDEPRLHAAARQAFDRKLAPERAADRNWLLSGMDLCHLGFWLRIGSYFLGRDPRLEQMAATILAVQYDDGGWNCQMRNYPERKHSSFNTTFNLLEGLREAVRAGNLDAAVFRKAEARALEFMLAHRMYRSDKTGEVVKERFTHLTYPSYWHYTVLRGLDYMREAPEIGDARLADPIALLESRRGNNGRWVTEKRIPGVTFFDMERFGGESRWNTLRALRVLKARTAAD